MNEGLSAFLHGVLIATDILDPGLPYHVLRADWEAMGSLEQTARFSPHQRVALADHWIDFRRNTSPLSRLEKCVPSGILARLLSISTLTSITPALEANAFNERFGDLLALGHVEEMHALDGLMAGCFVPMTRAELVKGEAVLGTPRGLIRGAPRENAFQPEMLKRDRDLILGELHSIGEAGMGASGRQMAIVYSYLSFRRWHPKEAFRLPDLLVGRDAYAFLQVETQPNEAEVSVNGEMWGASPVGRGVRPGGYDVSAERNAVRERQPVALAAGEHRVVRIAFPGGA